MSIVEDILRTLWDTTYYHKGWRVNIFGIPRFKKYSKRTLRTTIDRLAANNIIKKDLTGIVLSEEGKKYVEKKFNSLKSFSKPKEQLVLKNLLVMFDMPIHKKAERDWFRFHLKKFGYEMIQHSVWIGPSPLPKEFKEYVKEIKLDDCIKTFKLSSPYKTKS